MPDLLHEYWENDDGGDFSPVRERNDQLRPKLVPDARLVFRLRASSWHRAMQAYNERLGYGDYKPIGDAPDEPYTEQDAAEQEAYLLVRNGS